MKTRSKSIDCAMSGFRELRTLVIRAGCPLGDYRYIGILDQKLETGSRGQQAELDTQSQTTNHDAKRSTRKMTSGRRLVAHCIWGVVTHFHTLNYSVDTPLVHVKKRDTD